MRVLEGIVLFLCVVAIAFLYWACWGTISDKVHDKIDNKNDSTVTTPSDSEKTDAEQALEDSGIDIEIGRI